MAGEKTFPLYLSIVNRKSSKNKQVITIIMSEVVEGPRRVGTARATRGPWLPKPWRVSRGAVRAKQWQVGCADVAPLDPPQGLRTLVLKRVINAGLNVVPRGCDLQRFDVNAAVVGDANALAIEESDFVLGGDGSGVEPLRDAFIECRHLSSMDLCSCRFGLD